MRLNTYQFPDGIDPHTRYLHGAVCTFGQCDVSGSSWKGCSYFDGNSGCMDCSHYCAQVSADVIEGISITTAKKLLRLFGGQAWTQHIDRDGCVFETTRIQISGNHSKVKYNHHL